MKNSPVLGTVRAHGAEVPVLYEDNHLLVVVKPPNLPAQKDPSGDMDLQTLLKEYIKQKYQKPGNVFLGLCHRLDRPVGGVMVLARTSKAAARLCAQFAGRETQKGYLAVVHGRVDHSLMLKDHLAKGEDGFVRVCPEGAPGAKFAHLESFPIESGQSASLLWVALHTGRAHQIRVQHAHAGHPILGDMRYGRDRPGMQIALWAAGLAFSHPVGGARLAFVNLPPHVAPWDGYDGALRGFEMEGFV